MKIKSLFITGGLSLLAFYAFSGMQQTSKGSDDVSVGASSKTGQDWPVWTRNGSGNLYSPEKNLPEKFEPGEFIIGTENIDMSTTKNVRWISKLGSQSYGNTTVSNGKVYIGTNNESPRDKRHIGDRGIVYCLDEKTGAFQLQLVVPKLGAGKVSDWEYLGICSSPAVEGNRVYVVANSCEILCLDTEGFKNGNQGFQGEGKFMVDKGKSSLEPNNLDADIIWRYDMREELGVFPHNIASSSILIIGDLLFCTTSNGQDWSHLNIPAPLSPCIIALNKKDGTLAGEEAEGIGKAILHCNWSSPSGGKVKGKDAVFFGGGDGVLYAFDTKFKKDEEGYDIFSTLWKYDCNPADYKKDKDGKIIKYPAAEGLSEIIATPTYYNGKVYVAIGQDPEHGEGVGCLSCIDADTGKKVWEFKKIKRTISTCAVDASNGLLFAADYSGYVYCLDAESGELHWVYDQKAHMWGSPLVADGKVYIGDEDGDFVVLASDKKMKLLSETFFPAPIYSTPIVANGILYVATQSHLYALYNEDHKKKAAKNK